VKDQDEFAARAPRIGAEPRLQLGRDERNDRLELLGQLPAQRDWAPWTARRELAGECQYTVRRLEHDLCFDRVHEVSQSSFAFAAASRHETRDAIALRCDVAAHAYRGDSTAGAGDRDTTMAGRRGRRDQCGSGIRHGGRTGVADVGDAFSTRKSLEHAVGGLTFVVAVDSQQRFVDAVVT